MFVAFLDGACQLGGQCDPATGQCASLNIPDNVLCSDANLCTAGDSCKSGVCKSGPAKYCDDVNPCTADSCDLITACAHAPIEGCCKSDDDCAANERCQLDTNSCLPESTSSGSGGASGPIDNGSNGVSAPSASCSCRVLGAPANPSRNHVGWLLVIALGLGWRRRRHGVIQSRHAA